MKDPNGSSWTTLVGEDDREVRSKMEEAFRKVETKALLQFVPNGVEVIEYLEGKGIYEDRAAYPFPTLLLLDLKMPMLDGCEVLQWIKAHPRLKRLIVVMLTEADAPLDVRRLHELGANSYLVKSQLYREFTDLIKCTDIYWRKHNKL